jgi:hypothetical protein
MIFSLSQDSNLLPMPAPELLPVSDGYTAASVARFLGVTTSSLNPYAASGELLDVLFHPPQAFRFETAQTA